MAKKPKPSSDPVIAARRIVESVTGEKLAPEKKPAPAKKSPKHDGGEKK